MCKSLLVFLPYVFSSSIYLLYVFSILVFVFFFKQKTAYEMRISDWSSDVCSSDLTERAEPRCQRVPDAPHFSYRPLVEQTPAQLDVVEIDHPSPHLLGRLRQGVCHLG